MKLVALCFFAVCCSAFAKPKSQEMKKLEEVLRQMKDVKNSLQNTEEMLNTPPQDIEDCCCLSALQCFRANIRVHFSTPEKKKINQLHKSLRNPLTERGLNFCTSGNNATCQTCDSHPKVNGQEFFNRLESLIQRAISRLNMN